MTEVEKLVSEVRMRLKAATVGEFPAAYERSTLRKLVGLSSKVVSWYDHPKEVRGPFCRWFTCSEVAPEYQENVASVEDECRFATAAMNCLGPMLDLLDKRDADLSRMASVIEELRGALGMARTFASENYEAAITAKEHRIADGMDWLLSELDESLARADEIARGGE